MPCTVSVRGCGVDAARRQSTPTARSRALGLALADQQALRREVGERAGEERVVEQRGRAVCRRRAEPTADAAVGERRAGRSRARSPPRPRAACWTWSTNAWLKLTEPPLVELMTYSARTVDADRVAQLRLDRCGEHGGAGDQRDADEHRRGGARRALRVALHVAAGHRPGDAAHRLRPARRAPGRSAWPSPGPTSRTAGEHQPDADARAAAHRHRRAPRRSRRRRATPRPPRRSAGRAREPVRSKAVSTIAATGGTRPARTAGHRSGHERGHQPGDERDDHRRAGQLQAARRDAVAERVEQVADAERPDRCRRPARAPSRPGRSRSPRRAAPRSPGGGWRRRRAAARSPVAAAPWRSRRRCRSRTRRRRARRTRRSTGRR